MMLDLQSGRITMLAVEIRRLHYDKSDADDFRSDSRPQIVLTLQQGVGNSLPSLKVEIRRNEFREFRNG